MIYYLLACVAIFCYATLPVIAKKMQADIPSFTFISITMFILMVLSGIAAFFYERESFQISSLTTANWGLLVLIGVINFIGFSMFLFAITKIPVVEYQIMLTSMPIISGILAYFILSEGLSVKYFIGLAVIAIGLFIALKK